MSALVEKRDLLAQARFTYSFDREVYYKRETRQVFSVEYVEDHAVEHLEKCIRQLPKENDWHFYFNVAPSESVKRELQGVLL